MLPQGSGYGVSGHWRKDKDAAAAGGLIKGGNFYCNYNGELSTLIQTDFLRLPSLIRPFAAVFKTAVRNHECSRK